MITNYLTLDGNAGRVKWDEFPAKHSEDEQDDVTVSEESFLDIKTIFQKIIEVWNNLNYCICS